MGFWFYSYLITNLVIFIFYYKKTNGIFQAPFLMAYTAIFILLPQFATIYHNSFYDKRLIPDLGFVMISCNVSFLFGFEIIKRFVKKNKNIISILFLRKIKYFLLVIGVIGFTTVFLWAGTKFQEGDNVIQANMKSFSQMSFCLVLTSMLTYRVKNKFSIFMLALSVIPLFYFAFFVKGSRSETLFLLLSISMYLSFKNPQKEIIIRKWTLIILLAGALLSASIIWIRNVIINKSEYTELSLIDNFVDSFSQKKVSLGMDLGNAAIGIQYLKESNQLDYGTYMYDDFIQNIVPRRIVGETLKEGLKFKLVDDQLFIKQQTHGVTTMTGYYFAFRSFSYLGFLLYLLLGAFYGLIYCKIKNSASCLYLYLLILPTIPLIFTHSAGYLYMKIYINFAIAYIFCHKGFKQYRIIKNG